MARRPIHSTPATTGARPALQRRTRRRRNRPVDDGQLVNVGIADDGDLIIGKLAGSYPRNFFRSGEYTHVSDLIYKCNRMMALHYKTSTQIHGEPLYDSQAMCFAIGKTIEKFVVDKMIKNNPEEVYGRWSCHCLGAEEDFSPHVGVRPTEDCPTCYSPFHRYDELYLTNDEYMISGSVDVTLLIAAALYFTEIKSIKHEYWEALERPQPEHLIQVLFYWWLAREAGYAVHTQLSIVYVSKNYVFGSPYKEFVITPADEIERLNPYLEEAKELKQARYDNAALPPRPCPSSSYSVAKKCEMSTLCFGWDDNESE